MNWNLPPFSRRLGHASLVPALLTLAACASGAPRDNVPAAPPAPTYFYPQHGQTTEQQDRDRYECYRWAVGQSGHDPGMQAVQRPLAPVPEASPDPGAVAAGALTGAAVGAVTARPRDAGGAMVLGAVFGGLVGALSDERRVQAAAAEEAARRDRLQAERAAASADFRRALAACMAGRGYEVR